MKALTLDQYTIYEMSWREAVAGFGYQPDHVIERDPGGAHTCDLCATWEDTLIEGLCPACHSKYHPQSMYADPALRAEMCDPDDGQPTIAASTLAQAAQLNALIGDHLGDLNPDLHTLAFLLTEFLNQRALDLRKQGRVELEYIGTLCRVDGEWEVR